MQVTTLLAELETLSWWAVRTLGSDRHELRELLRAWVHVSGATVRNDVLGGIADHVHGLHQGGA